MVREAAERFARALHGSTLQKRVYEPAAGQEWLRNHGLGTLAGGPRKAERVAPWVDERYERPSLADYDEFQRKLAGIPPILGKTREQQLAELEQLKAAAE